jgi:post-segregation antitoxin (ccd killing protein)
MAKLSISVPDEIVDDLRSFGAENVSAFVTTAIRHEVDRRRLFAFLDELEDELGPVDEEEVAAFSETLAQLGAPRRNPPRATTAKARPRPAKATAARSRSAS